VSDRGVLVLEKAVGAPVFGQIVSEDHAEIRDDGAAVGIERQRGEALCAAIETEKNAHRRPRSFELQRLTCPCGERLTGGAQRRRATARDLDRRHSRSVVGPGARAR
jgi:hypothetical protein